MNDSLKVAYTVEAAVGSLAWSAPLIVLGALSSWLAFRFKKPANADRVAAG